jgi:hypothetical protein
VRPRQSNGETAVLLPGQIPLHRIEAPLDDLADNVRRHEVHPAGPLGESLADALQAGAEVRREPNDELPVLGSAH